MGVIVFIILFQWNWLRGPLARAISARLHRPVTITGNLEVHPWSWSPTATLNGLVIGNAKWGGKTPLATIPRFTVQVKILPLLRGKVILPLVEADNPDVDLERDLKGEENWDFNPGHHNAKAATVPTIHHLVIRDGKVAYDDPLRKLRFAGTMSSNETVRGVGQGGFVLKGNGTFNGDPFTAYVSGGALINIDPNHPYRFRVGLNAEKTRLRVEGSIARPFNLARVSGRVTIEGDDLANLYRVTGIVLPDTPPYELTAGFARDGKVYAFRKIQGRVGESDLEGSLSVDDTSGRPFLRGDLASRNLRLADLVAVVGGVPKHGVKGQLSASEQVEAARLRAEHRLLPDATLAADRIGGMDAKVDYTAARVQAGRIPIRDLRLDVTLDHSLLTVDPLELTLSQGRLSGAIRINARRRPQTNSLDLRLTDARLETLFPPKAGKPVIEGGLWARAHLTGTGSSIRAAAADANGTVTGIVPGGELRKTIADLLGLDLGRTAIALITKSKSDTPVRCAVVDFRATNGILNADGIVLDTDLVRINGTGLIDLRDETVNLRLQGKPKKITLAHLDAPFTVTGRLASPKIGVDLVKAAPQVGIAVAIGVFAAPLAAILPFIAGRAKNADCAALETGAAQMGGPHPTRR